MYGSQLKIALPGFASLSGVTTGTGRPLSVNDMFRFGWIVTYTAGSAPTSGTVIIECAPTPDYAGTWFILQTITLANVVTGAEGVGQRDNGAVGFVRARIGTNADQAISVFLNGLV